MREGSMRPTGSHCSRRRPRSTWFRNGLIRAKVLRGATSETYVSRAWIIISPHSVAALMIASKIALRCGRPAYCRAINSSAATVICTFHNRLEDRVARADKRARATQLQHVLNPRFPTASEICEHSPAVLDEPAA